MVAEQDGIILVLRNTQAACYSDVEHVFGPTEDKKSPRGSGTTIDLAWESSGVRRQNRLLGGPQVGQAFPALQRKDNLTILTPMTGLMVATRQDYP
jgi:hypothetical protein